MHLLVSKSCIVGREGLVNSIGFINVTRVGLVTSVCRFCLGCVDVCVCGTICCWGARGGGVSALGSSV